MNKILTTLTLTATGVYADTAYINNSQIYLDNAEVVTEVNYDYNYTASIDKGNGGGFLTTQTYSTGNAFSYSKEVQDNLNNSYVQFAATLTAQDVSCTTGTHSYACDVFQTAFIYQDANSTTKLVYGLSVLNGNWTMNVFDITDSVAGTVRRTIHSTTGAAFTEDSRHSTYRFVSTSTGVQFTRNDEVLVEWDSAVPNPHSIAPFPTLPSYTLNTDFALITATLGSSTNFEGADPKECDFMLTNTAGYIMWRPGTPETDGAAAAPAMAMFLMDDLAAGSTVPEPTTATLSLLALAGLAARRRRK